MSFLEERYEIAACRVREIGREHILEGAFGRFFAENACYLQIMTEEYDWVKKGGPKEAELDEVMRHNEICHIDLCGRNYENHFANPTYAAEQLGKEYGPLLSALCAELHSLPAWVYEQELEAVTIRLELFLEIYHTFCYAKEEENTLPDAETIREIIYWFASDYSEIVMEYKMKGLVDWEDNFALDIIENSDLSDARYLYRYGEYITGSQIQMAEHLNSLSDEELQKIADTYTEGYRLGFEMAKKPLYKKKSVNIRYPLGFELVVKKAIENFRKMGLEPVIYRASSSFMEGRSVNRNGYFGAAVNKQFDYDHEKDCALYYDKKYIAHKLECARNALEALKEKALLHAGPAVIESFGEEPFEPVNKPERLKFDEDQQKLFVEYQSQFGELLREYIPPQERSFTIIAFPVPEIGSDFAAIFNETVKINTLDYKLYQGIQQTIIDALDKAEYVRIKGCGDNVTDLKIMLHELADPQNETNFENCVADVNIPVGEVFTSPRLTGTDGVLHVTEVFLNELKYQNLKITFKDGKITDYDCTNFEDPEDGKKFIKENVLFNHETLPMGEFAIGTNTTAYVVAERFGIKDKLPILIAEKMGPHFAVGDTCYSHEEDMMTYNPDGKAIVARDNEVSVLRKENPSQAYFNCHTDITIPYDELGELTAVSKDGTEFLIIKDGRFVLKGCEELNVPFMV